MKKNLITVVILALVLVNLILTAILMITILPETKKANQLITQVCSAIDLELKSGSTSSDAEVVPLDKIATLDIAEDMTINLRVGEDGSSNHYAVLTASISMNTESEGYDTYGETIADKTSLIKDAINSRVSQYTYEEFNSDQQAVKDAIVSDLQKAFDSDFIISVKFPTVRCQ